MSEFLMRRPRGLFTRNKQVRRKLKRNQTVRIAPSDMTLIRARFGVLVKWKPIMYQLGLRVVRLQPRIVRCCVKLTIEQKGIVNVPKAKIMKSDTLKRKIYAEKIAEEIETHYDSKKETGHKDNIVFAISGKWGEGKTELLNLLEPKLTDKGFTVIRFNPWQYSHEDISLKRSFLRVVKEKINSEVDLSDLYYDRSKTVIDWNSVALPLLKIILLGAFVLD